MCTWCLSPLSPLLYIYHHPSLESNAPHSFSSPNKSSTPFNLPFLLNQNRMSLLSLQWRPITHLSLQGIRTSHLSLYPSDGLLSLSLKTDGFYSPTHFPRELHAHTHLTPRESFLPRCIEMLVVPSTLLNTSLYLTGPSSFASYNRECFKGIQPFALHFSLHLLTEDPPRRGCQSSRNIHSTPRARLSKQANII